MRCGKPLVYLVLSPKEICVWMLEVWPVNNEHSRPRFCFGGWHTFQIMDLGQLLELLSLPWERLLCLDLASVLGLYPNLSFEISLEGSKVKPVRNKFSGWKVKNGKESDRR